MFVNFWKDIWVYLHISLYVDNTMKFESYRHMNVRSKTVWRPGVISQLCETPSSIPTRAKIFLSPRSWKLTLGSNWSYNKLVSQVFKCLHSLRCFHGVHKEMGIWTLTAFSWKSSIKSYTNNSNFFTIFSDMSVCLFSCHTTCISVNVKNQ